MVVSNKKMAVLPYCGYSYVLAFATRMFPGLALRSLINFRCLAFVLKVGVKVVVILVVLAVGRPRAFIKKVVDLAYTNKPGTRYGAYFFSSCNETTHSREGLASCIGTSDNEIRGSGVMEGKC